MAMRDRSPLVMVALGRRNSVSLRRTKPVAGASITGPVTRMRCFTPAVVRTFGGWGGG